MRAACHDDFISDLHNVRVCVVTYVHTDGSTRRDRCAPLDFGRTNAAGQELSKYQFWNYDGTDGAHPFLKPADAITSYESTTDHFDPTQFAHWAPWTVERVTWGPQA